MRYRQFGKLDWKPSALGFGCMRLPLLDQDMAHVDEAEAIRMIRYAIDHGVNYLDTAAVYHSGNSERVVGKALQDGYRQKVGLATKLTLFALKSASQFDRFFNNQLERLQTGKIDFYLLHGLTRQLWEFAKESKAIPFVESKIAKGQIGYLGFSFHDEYDVFKEIVDAYDNWTFCQIQYNYMDIKNQAGRRGLRYAAGKGLAVVIMEPIRGGILAKEPSPPVAKVWQTAPGNRSQAEWALQWLWNQPEVSVVLSGMSTMEQVIENVASAGRSGVGKLTRDETSFIDKVRKAYLGSSPIPCTKCGYCLPCPNGVAIATIFDLYNEASMYDDFTRAPFFYMGFAPGGLKADQRADNCQECEECLEKCPQHIAIPDWLEKAHKKLFLKDFKPPPPPPLPE
jgi:predicted aldo/keto reductase-like oxidoreductase